MRYVFLNNDPINFYDFLGLKNCKPKPGYIPSSNGCGPESPRWLNFIIPEGVFPSLGGYDFGPACDAHDICYGTCCSDKGNCDTQFLYNMRSQCDKWVDWLYGSGGPFSFIGDSSFKEGDRQTCYDDATLYHYAVAAHGNSAFDSAQKAACACP